MGEDEAERVALRERLRAVHAAQPAVRPGPAWRFASFPLARVVLGESVAREKQERMLHLARSFPVDRVLALFRAEAGLPTGGAEPPGEWEDPSCLLRGHWAGHFLSMVAQAWAGTGEQVFAEKLAQLVDGLAECQDAMTASGRYSHPGYLAAYPEDQFAQLEEFATYPGIWAPWYTCHKILEGLLDCHRLGGSDRALEVATALGRWAHHRLSGTDHAQRQRMWSLYIAGEWGGMSETLTALTALTGDPVFAETARWFDHAELIDACADGRDVLDGLHANQHLPQFLGCLEQYDHSGDQRYRRAAEQFFTMVVPHRTYSHGGTGQEEMFRGRDVIAGSIVGATNAETCCAYNLLELARRLFLLSGDIALLDFSERVLLNQLLGSRADTDSDDDPLVTYMLPVSPGAVREFGNRGTCCGGTGLETFTKLQETVFLRSVDDTTLVVAQYLPATLDWVERGVVVEQSGPFPGAGAATLRVTGEAPFTLALRVPHWVRRGFTVRVNGERQPLDARPGGTVSLTRDWRTGDTVEIAMPFSLRVERSLDDPSLVSVLHGPVALVARDASTEELPLVAEVTDSGELSSAFTPVDDRPHHLVGAGHRWAPLYEGTPDPYHLYLRLQEPGAGDAAG